MKISIITVNYNNKVGLQKTIDSVLCQTWKDYEWIVIDGGSTDGSKELIEQYQQQFVYWCSEPDKGVYHAMNKGVAKASGEYVNFMNSGDAFYDENVLQKIYNLHSDADIIIGQVVNMENNELLNQYNVSLFLRIYQYNISHQGTFIKRILLTQNPYDEGLKIAADWKFWLQKIILDDAKVDFSDIIIAKYDMTGISSGVDMESRSLHVYEREKIKKELFPPLIRKELELYIQLRKSIYTKYGEYLYNNNHILFSIGWRFLKLLTYVCRLCCQRHK